MGALRILFGLLLITVTSWIVFFYALKLLFWILSKTVGISIEFQIGGWNCLKDIAVKLKKGALESLVVSEIKLTLCQPSVKLGNGIISKNLKLQLVISDPEIVLRPKSKSSSSKSSKKAKSSKPRSSGKGKKLMAVGNIARFLSVSITDLVLKTPKAAIEVKGIKLDICKDGGSKPNLFVILQILPISVQAIQPLSGVMEKPSAPSCCEEFSFSCEFGNDGEAGLVVRNVDINFGEIIVNLNEELLAKNKKPPDVSSQTDKVKESTADSLPAKKPDKKQAAILALSKHTSIFPEKICFNLPKLDVKFVHREHDVVVENNIKSIQLKSIKSRSTEEVESTRIDVQLEFSEIHLLRESGSAVLEIMKFGVASFVNIPVQPISPVRAEVDVKFGGIRSTVIMTSLKRFLKLKPPSTGSKKKAMVLQAETSTIPKPQSTEPKAIMWKCTVSVPDITIVLYSISDVPLYQCCLQSAYVLANDISSTGIAVHAELGELNLQVADENHECLKENVFSVESNSGSLLNIAKVSVDWGKKDMESSEDGGPRCKLVLSADVTGIGLYFTSKRVESLIVTAITFQALFKKPSSGKKTTQSRAARSSKPSGKVVADPKRVNYGSQGGRIVISVSADVLLTSPSLGRPDMCLSFAELGLQLKALVQNEKAKHKGPGNEHADNISIEKDAEQRKEVIGVESGHVDKPKKKESVFALDIEMLSIFAEAGDGVDAFVQVQSIFSENARIGVLLEGLMLSFNGAQLLRSGRMQISRIPNVSSSSDTNVPVVTVWDFVIQALDVYICLPFRLELRAIDDVVEEMIRALKIVIAAKTQLILPPKKDNPKPKKPSSSKFGCAKFFIRKLTGEIEEEPIQGWLDEHYQLMKKEVIELGARLKLFDDYISANQCPKTTETNDSSSERRVHYNGTEIDMQDPSAIQKMKDEIYRQSFQSYYLACQKLKPAEGSGSYREGLQSGFKPSTARVSLFTISGTDLDVTVTMIDGGNDGMIEIIKQLDPVCRETEIPFSRLYGCNLLLNAGSLGVQIRDYTFPLFSAVSGRCEGRLVMAQQATAFQPQISHDVFIGRWRKVRMLRSATGTTPPMKTYTDLGLRFKSAEVSFGVGYETVLADVSYAFTVALRRANLSKKGPGLPVQPKKEKSLPWWDDMRNYVHGNNTLIISETKWYIQASSDPYEKLDKLQIVSGPLEIQQSDGRIYSCVRDFKVFLSSLESLIDSRSLKIPTIVYGPFLEVPVFSLEVLMDWDCESGYPMNHYLFALPVEGKVREKMLDPFRSTALSLRFDIAFKALVPPSDKQTPSASDSTVVDGTVNEAENVSIASPTFSFNAHDLAWLAKFGNLMILPPHKIRLFARFPRFGVPRIPRSGNLPLDRVMTETMFRLDSTPTCIKYKTFSDDDPAKGLTFSTTKFKVEVCSSRGKQKFTFDCQRDPLDLVYLGVDLHLLKGFLDKEDCTSVTKVVQTSQSASMEQVPTEKSNSTSGCTEKHPDEGFFLSADYFTIRKQSPKADPESLLAWQEAGKKHHGVTYVRSKSEKARESDEHEQSDPSDDDGYCVLIADNCQRIFLYSLKILMNVENRDAVRSFGAALGKALVPRKPCASRQYRQRKLLEEKQRLAEQKLAEPEMPQEDALKSPSTNNAVPSPSQNTETSGSDSSLPQAAGMENSSTAAVEQAKTEKVDGSEEEGTRHFMVNIIEPQFNLHSEDANGRFLLAAATGRVLARSFHSVLRVGSEVIEKALGTGNVRIPEGGHDMTLKRMEFSVMLEHVQAHVAPTDVDLGAGVQWLPKIRRSSPKVKRTGALLERVFTPCDMYFRFTRHKSGTPELKVKPLKDLSFNSQSITASMTSRQFQVMLDVLTNLLFARAPKPAMLDYKDDQELKVELDKITLEQKEWELRLLLSDIKKISIHCDTSGDNPEKEGDWWMVNGGKSILVQGLKKELVNAKKFRKEASAALRVTMQKAAQQRLMEKEKNKSPSCAMRVSVQITKVVWSMLMDGKSFAEVEINDMMSRPELTVIKIYDFDRDYRDVGVALFTTKSIIIRNCLANAKSDTLLSAWNPPPEWGKNVLLRVDAKQGTPKDGNSVLELLQVDIYPLKIHLTEAMYRMVWGYLFPSEDQDSQKRKEVWKVSTVAGARRAKKGSIDASSGSQASKESEASSKSNVSITDQSTDSPRTSKLPDLKPGTGLRRTSSFDRTWEDTVAESIANELVMQAQLLDDQDESSKNKTKDAKSAKSGRPAQEEKKVVGKPIEEKKTTRPPKLIEFRNIKISQVELCLTYEGSRFAVSDVKLLMDTFHRVEFTGSWRRLFSRVKKHVIWGVLKSFTGMQGKKFKDKLHSQQPSITNIPDGELHLSDNDQASQSDQKSTTFLKRSTDGAGDGFVTSVRGLFNNQRRKAKQFVLRTMRGEAETDRPGEWSEGEAEISPFARQLTITKAKKLIRRHTKKFEKDASPMNTTDPAAYESDSSSGSELIEELSRVQKK
ncbi:hypothetical protein GOBAR_DD25836 [Gossypium barbadense]|nr:hypothetical protein GOBAR_DD25836 [Gossypium barbadense]